MMSIEHYNNLGEYVCSNKYSVLINLISTTIGAFLGFLFALIIYWLTEFKKRKNLKHYEKVKAFNTLQRFSLILKSVIKTCKEQSDLFKLHSKDLKAKPLNFHFPQIPVTNDRDRLIESDTFKLYNSFMLFDKDNPNKFNDYKNIFNHSDFLHKYFADLYIQNEKHQNFLHSDLKLIRDNLLYIVIKIGLLQKDIQMKDPKGYVNNKEFQFLEKYRNIYLSLKGTGFTDLEPYRDKFLLPLQLELFGNISVQEIANDITFQIANAITRIDNMIFNTQTHADNLTNIEGEENVKSAINYLSKIQEKIEKINAP